MKSLRKYAFLALFTVYVLYILANVAFFAAGVCISNYIQCSSLPYGNISDHGNTPVSKYDLVNSGTTVATLFFRSVFGDSGAVRGLNFLIALSAFGNIVASALGSSRMIRECGR